MTLIHLIRSILRSCTWFSDQVVIPVKQVNLLFSCVAFLLPRFPKLFPPLKPEVVAQRTVDAVRTNTAFVYLPWTMNVLVILKRYHLSEIELLKSLFQMSFWIANSFVILFYPWNSILPQSALEEIHRFSGSYTCMNTFKGRTWENLEVPQEFQVLHFQTNCFIVEQQQWHSGMKMRPFSWSLPEATSKSEKSPKDTVTHQRMPRFKNICRSPPTSVLCCWTITEGTWSLNRLLFSVCT